MHDAIHMHIGLPDVNEYVAYSWKLTVTNYNENDVQKLKLNNHKKIITPWTNISCNYNDFCN